jgi:hypothetical protein
MTRPRPSKQILVAFSAPGLGALGAIWRITAKKNDFYLDPLGVEDSVHLSVHGPNDAHPDAHRFHVKIDQKGVAAVRARGDFVSHGIPRDRGYPFDGEELAPGVFRVARIRWLWDLQRPRFRQAAAFGPVPEISDSRSGRVLAARLEPNEAADLDLVLSYEEPHWLGGPDNDSRLGPLRNEAGMWLTATYLRRSQATRPAPSELIPPLPRPGEEPNRFLGGGSGNDEGDDGGEGGEFYWFVESITSREFLDSVRTNADQPA